MGIDMRYLDAFERAVDCHPNKTALVRGDGEELTYRELDRRATSLAGTFEEHVPGERVATLAINGEPAIVSQLAALKRGYANAQLPFRNSLSNLVSMIETTGARALLFDDANAEAAKQVIDHLDLDVAIHAGAVDIATDDPIAYQEAVSKDDASVEPAPEEEFGVFFTSGTIGEPKAVLFDQEQMWLGSTQVIMEMSITETDVGLMCAPWYHMFGTDAWVLPHLQAGATLVLQSDFDPAGALELIERHDITGVPAVPTQLNAMLDVLESEVYDVASLEKIRTGGAVVPVSLIREVENEMTEGVFNTYGCTEAGPNMTFAHPSVQEDHPGTIGKASFMWDLRVVDPAPPTEDPDPAAEVGPGGTGEIIVRGPGMGEGYLGNPETPADLIVDGWLRTKDIAEVDEDAYLVVIDRVDNMLNSGGENVYPQEVERVLEDYPGIDDVGVVGIEDEHWGDLITAVIQTTGEVTEDELDRHCRKSDDLADFKRPRRYEFTEQDLPRTETGTLQREILALDFVEN